MNTDFFYHEQLYRSEELMRRLRDFRITVCGAGALGANLIESMARQGFATLKVIDRDRIEERNLSTQPYYASDVGAFKSKILANSLYRALGVKIEARAEELTAQNATKLLQNSQLVVDVFDNSVSRRVVKETCETAAIDCLHAGLADGYAEIIWNEKYRVPSASQDDVCDYPLARNLVTLTIAVIGETIVKFIASGEQQNYTITIADFSIQPLF